MSGVVHAPHPGKGGKATACGLTWDDWEKIKKPGEQDISEVDDRVNCSKCSKGKPS